MLTIESPDKSSTIQQVQRPPAKGACRKVSLSQCVRRETEWLWPQRVELGRLTVLVGEMGLGKSEVVADLAARVSRGGEWPDQPGMNAPPGSVLYIAAEHERDSVLPARLLAARADLERVCTIEPEVAEGEFIDPPTMQEQLDAIETAIRETPDCKLMVIDPLVAMLEGEEKANAATVQQLLRALAKIARRQRVAMVATADLNLRASLQSVDRLTRVFRTACSGTQILGVFRDPDAARQSLIVPLEVNFAAEQKALSFRLSNDLPGGTGKRSLPVEIDGTIDSSLADQHWQTALASATQHSSTQHSSTHHSITEHSSTHHSGTQVIAWCEELPTSLEKLLTRVRFNGVEQTYRDKEHFFTTRLREVLSNGPMARADLKWKAGTDEQQYRAAERLGVIKQKAGYNDGWIWMLPEHHPAWQEKQNARAEKQRERKTEKQRERRTEERTVRREVVEGEDLQEAAEKTEKTEKAGLDVAAHAAERPVVAVSADEADLRPAVEVGAGSGGAPTTESCLAGLATCSNNVDVSLRETKCLSRSERSTMAQRPDKPRWHKRDFTVGGRKLTVKTPADMSEAEREVATQQLLKQEADFQRDAEQAEARMREAGEWEEEWEVDSS